MSTVISQQPQSLLVSYSNVPSTDRNEALNIPLCINKQKLKNVNNTVHNQDRRTINAVNNFGTMLHSDAPIFCFPSALKSVRLFTFEYRLP